MTLSNHYEASDVFKEEYENLEIPRHVTITPLGSFYPKGITMPANPHHARQICLLAEPLPKDATAKNFPSRLMDVIFERKHDRSCQPTVTLGDSRRHRLHCRCSSTWPEDFRVSSFQTMHLIRKGLVLRTSGAQTMHKSPIYF